MISRNDGERKNHINDDEQMAATTNNDDDQSRIYELSQSPEAMGRPMALVSCSGASSFPRNRSRKFTLSIDESRLFITTKQANLPKSGLTMTVKTGRLDKAINNQRSFANTSDDERQEYVSFIVVAALQEEKSF